MAARYVLDASALLCLLNAEPGAAIVEQALSESIISAVNYSETVAKLVERGATPELAASILGPLHIEVVDFDRTQAVSAGVHRSVTRQAGLSFGDRACLALAGLRGLTALTTDRAWSSLDLNVAVQQVRDV